MGQNIGERVSQATRGKQNENRLKVKLTKKKGRSDSYINGSEMEGVDRGGKRSVRVEIMKEL